MPILANQNGLAVELEIQDTSANAKLDRFEARLNHVGSGPPIDLSKTSFAGKFGDQLDRATKRHDDFLAKISKSEAEHAAKVEKLGAVIGQAIGVGVAGAAVAGTAAVLLGAKAYQTYSEESIKAKQRTAELRTAAVELGLDFRKATADIDRLADKLGSLDDAQTVYLKSAELNKGQRAGSNADFARGILDIGASRGLDPNETAKALDNLNKGLADSNLLGANASTIFDQYASTIGKTADQLSDADKKQALANETFLIMQRNVGAADEAMRNAAGSADNLGKVWTNILKNIGSAISPEVEAFLRAVETASGGKSKGPRFDTGRAFWTNAYNGLTGGNVISAGPEIYTDDIEAEVGDAVKRHKAILEQFKRNEDEFRKAQGDPSGNLVNYILSHFLDPGYLQMGPEQQQQAKRAAIVVGNEFAKMQKEVIEGALRRGNIGEVGNLFDTLKVFENILDPEDTKKYFDKAQSILKANYKRLADDAGDDVKKLRDVLAQTTKDKYLSSDVRGDLTRGLNREINTQVDKAMAKVTELAKTWTSAFDSLYQKSNSENPFALFLQKSASESEKLKDSLRGLPPELRKVALAMNAAATQKEDFRIGIDHALSASSLRYDADRFRNPVIPGNGHLDPYQYAAAKTFLDYNPNFLKTHQNASDSDIYGAASLNQRLEDEYRNIYDTRREGFDKGIADRKFIDLTQGANSLDLTDRLRGAAADARLNEAARQENYLKDAQKSRVDMVKLLGDIKQAQQDFVKTANAGGKQAVDIRLSDDTSDKKVTNATVATEDDVAKTYNLGFFGGSNL